MNVVDSSGWLEYFANGVNADFFAPAITDEERLFVPTICLYEVFNRLSLLRGKEDALPGALLATFARLFFFNLQPGWRA